MAAWMSKPQSTNINGRYKTYKVKFYQKHIKVLLI